MFGESGVSATAVTKSGEARKSARKEKKFEVGDEKLVAHGPAFSKTHNWAAFQLYFYRLYRVTIADHPRYELVSYAGRLIFSGIQSRRLALYGNRTARLLK